MIAPTLHEAVANEAAAQADIVAALPPRAARELGAEVLDIEGAVAISVAATGTAFFNRVIGLGALTTTTADRIMTAVAFFRARSTPFMLHFDDSEDYDEFWPLLADQGFTPERNWVILARDDSPTTERPSRAVREVRSDEATLFGATVCAGYGMPDEWAPLFSALVGRPRWEHFFALDDGSAPIATGSVFLSDRVAWHGNAGTLPRARRLGAHSSISATRVTRCAAAGLCSTGETWQEDERVRNSSLHNHLRFGWREVGVRRNAVWRG